VSDKKPFHIRVFEERTFEFEVLASSETDALQMAAKTWREADTVGQWETDAVATEFEAAEIVHEPGALPSAPANA
jgi:GMP synthase-like glutamine amidotransferase